MSGPVDPVGDNMRHENPGKPALAAGRVITAPNAQGTILVQLVGWSSHHAYEIPRSHWMPRANPALDTAGGAGPPLVPAVDDRCLVVFDHLGDAWVACWGTS